jgi:hypothetical protein
LKNAIFKWLSLINPKYEQNLADKLKKAENWKDPDPVHRKLAYFTYRAAEACKDYSS